MLRLAETIGLETGKPTKELNDSDWQQCFNLMKLINYETPVRRCMPYYLPELDFGGYAEFLNGVLFNIREGEKDYCTRIYQVVDLLKIEGNTLQSRYLPDEQLFEVWLEVD